MKGASSGATQELLRVDLDCDRDTLRFTVRQAGEGFCHGPASTCWGDASGLGELERRIAERVRDADVESNTVRLFRNPALLASKLREEAVELNEARTPDEVRHEAADVLYFLMVRLAAEGVSLADVTGELERRSRKVSRRPCEAKV